ncbi:MAG: 50S ribosomal protein L9 [Dehalococcoidia bacterium]|nr:50S ribosomal protein L9 [Dehalococcoidia bacterium]
MKVLFLESIEGSASMGEVKDVANGYARNYLLPNGLAVPATEKNLKNVEVLQTKELEQQKERDEWAEIVSPKIENELVFKVAVGQQGRLYGSVNHSDIAEKLTEELSEPIDKRFILISEIIREAGVYEASIRLSINVIKDIKIVVIDEQTEDVEAVTKKMINDFDAGIVTTSDSTGDAILFDEDNEIKEELSSLNETEETQDSNSEETQDSNSEETQDSNSEEIQDSNSEEEHSQS